MIFNNVEMNIKEVLANQYSIEINSDNLSIFLNFNREKIDLKSITINETIDLNKYINWDVSIKYKDDNLLFDISKDIVELTRIEDNKYKLFIDINNPDMIIPKPSFDNLKIDTTFSFDYDYKPTVNKDILKVEPSCEQPNLMDVLDKL
jgi:hypothetical protein